jgi:hypothetical protein
LGQGAPGRDDARRSIKGDAGRGLNKFVQGSMFKVQGLS